MQPNPNDELGALLRSHVQSVSTQSLSTYETFSVKIPQTYSLHHCVFLINLYISTKCFCCQISTKCFILIQSLLLPLFPFQPYLQFVLPQNLLQFRFKPSLYPGLILSINTFNSKAGSSSEILYASESFNICRSGCLSTPL